MKSSHWHPSGTSHRRTDIAVIFAGGDGCYKVLKREPMLASRIFIWQKFQRLTEQEVLATLPAFHDLWAGVDHQLVRGIDRAAAHGNFRNWATITKHTLNAIKKIGTDPGRRGPRQVDPRQALRHVEHRPGRHGRGAPGGPDNGSHRPGSPSTGRPRHGRKEWAVLGPGEVTLVVDEQDDLHYTRAALAAHRPQDGRITVQPTPANSGPAALAHDVLYALGKRLASGPNSSDAALDSVDLAWRAAAAWSVAAGVRHVVVILAHLLTARRVNQLLDWSELAGVPLTLVWHRPPLGLPSALAGVQRVSDPARFASVLAEPGPAQRRRAFPPAVAGVAGQAATAAGPLRPGYPLSEPGLPGPGRSCAGATVTARSTSPIPAGEVASETAAALCPVAHPLVAGALGVVAFTRGSLGSLRWTRDLDITRDISLIKIHEPAHRRCRLFTVPFWARPQLAGTRALHRLTPSAPESVFSQLLVKEGRYLRAHAEQIPGFAALSFGSFLAP
ncbi:hypothetical protein [Peterkaempfera bronchialis]|uniref:hypothetical protein n=1 Tax=Peterkaempfera bronchialis TaxID=2126346 RepID=UPI003C2ACC4D